MLHRRCAFVLSEIISGLKLLRLAIGSVFGIAYFGTSLWRIVAMAATAVGVFVALSTVCYKVFEFISVYLLDASDICAASDLLHFVGYVCNFDFLYKFFTLYYFSFCTLLVSFLTIYIIEFTMEVFPEMLEGIFTAIKTFFD